MKNPPEGDPTAAKPTAEGVVILLPIESLALTPGVQPRAGDVVDLTGEARVEIVSDGKARLVITKLNDATPLPATEVPVAEGEDDDAEFKKLQDAAAKADASGDSESDYV